MRMVCVAMRSFDRWVFRCLVRLVYGNQWGVAPDTRFSDAPRVPVERELLPDGTYLAKIAGVPLPFRVYDLRPTLERIWAARNAS